MKSEEKLELLNSVFSPTAPIEDPQYFRGREEQILQIREAIEERGQHAVIYGNRGVGKTSLANILNDIYDGIIVSKITCNHRDTFYSIWDKAIRKIKLIAPDSKIGFNAKNQEKIIELSLPPTERVDPSHVEEVMYYIPEPTLFIFDEFDSITDKEIKQAMADTIKTLSDNVPHITVLLVGIADDVSTLIGENPSVERCILQIHLPEMNLNEAEEIISEGLKKVEIKIDKSLINRIIEYSCGFPHYIHLMCKFAARNAIIDHRNEIIASDLDDAVTLSIENSSQSLITSFTTATKSSRPKNQFEDIIYACSLVDSIYQSSFTNEDVLAKFNEVTHSDVGKESINYNLGMLCKPERGLILEKIGSKKNARYKFRNPLMKAYIKLQLHKVKSENK